MNKHAFLTVLTILLCSCASAPAFQSYYVGDGNLQWYVQPVNLQTGTEGTVSVDFTYRRIAGQENFVRFNLTWNYLHAPQGVPNPVFILNGQDPIPVTKVEVLFREQANKVLRLASIMKESDFLRLLKAPQGKLRLESENETVEFPTSAAFETVLKQLAVELQ